MRAKTAEVDANNSAFPAPTEVCKVKIAACAMGLGGKFVDDSLISRMEPSRRLRCRGDVAQELSPSEHSIPRNAVCGARLIMSH